MTMSELIAMLNSDMSGDSEINTGETPAPCDSDIGPVTDWTI